MCLIGRTLLQFKRDSNARFSKDEQERNGDKDPHENKIWPVHGQLRSGRKRTSGQVSLFVVSSIHWCKNVSVCWLCSWAGGMEFATITRWVYVNLVIIVDLLSAREAFKLNMSNPAFHPGEMEQTETRLGTRNGNAFLFALGFQVS